MLVLIFLEDITFYIKKKKKKRKKGRKIYLARGINCKNERIIHILKDMFCKVWRISKKIKQSYVT